MEIALTKMHQGFHISSSNVQISHDDTELKRISIGLHAISKLQFISLKSETLIQINIECLVRDMASQIIRVRYYFPAVWNSIRMDNHLHVLNDETAASCLKIKELVDLEMKQDQNIFQFYRVIIPIMLPKSHRLASAMNHTSDENPSHDPDNDDLKGIYKISCSDWFNIVDKASCDHLVLPSFSLSDPVQQDQLNTTLKSLLYSRLINHLDQFIPIEVDGIIPSSMKYLGNCSSNIITIIEINPDDHLFANELKACTKSYRDLTDSRDGISASTSRDDLQSYLDPVTNAYKMSSEADSQSILTSFTEVFLRLKRDGTITEQTYNTLQEYLPSISFSFEMFPLLMNRPLCSLLHIKVYQLSIPTLHHTKSSLTSKLSNDYITRSSMIASKPENMNIETIPLLNDFASIQSRSKSSPSTSELANELMLNEIWYQHMRSFITVTYDALLVNIPVSMTDIDMVLDQCRHQIYDIDISILCRRLNLPMENRKPFSIIDCECYKSLSSAFLTTIGKRISSSSTSHVFVETESQTYTSDNAGQKSDMNISKKSDEHFVQFYLMFRTEESMAYTIELLPSSAEGFIKDFISICYQLKNARLLDWADICLRMDVMIPEKEKSIHKLKRAASSSSSFSQLYQNFQDSDEDISVASCEAKSYSFFDEMSHRVRMFVARDTLNYLMTTAASLTFESIDLVRQSLSELDNVAYKDLVYNFMTPQSSKRFASIDYLHGHSNDFVTAAFVKELTSFQSGILFKGEKI
jgi:hypothetical protein